MKTRIKTKAFSRTWLALPAAAMIGLSGFSVSAAGLTINSTAPTPGANDVYNFAGAAADGGNVNNGTAYPNGWLNDGYTYVAADRVNQGQRFTTLGAGQLSSIWVQHAGYMANSDPGLGTYNGTWWRISSGSTFTIRVTDPSQAGTAGFVLGLETYAATGIEGWNNQAYNNSDNGDGTWLQFTLASPISLTAGGNYGFDLSISNPGGGNTFFEWLGNNTGTGAYQGNTTGNAGGPDNVLNGLAGERVFLAGITPVPEPGTGALLLCGAGCLAGFLRRKQDQA